MRFTLGLFSFADQCTGSVMDADSIHCPPSTGRAEADMTCVACNVVSVGLQHVFATLYLGESPFPFPGS